MNAPAPCACGGRVFVRDTYVPNLRSSMGELEVLFCRACGKVEWFVTEPEKVPIGETYGTELVEAGPNAPYR